MDSGTGLTAGQSDHIFDPFFSTKPGGLGIGLSVSRSIVEMSLTALCNMAWRDLPVPGRELAGIHQAMEYLPLANRVQQGDVSKSSIDVAGQHVVIIGGW